MTVTYDLTTLIGKVRLKTGDNKILSPGFTDEEIQVFLDSTSNSLNLASAELLESWAAKYGASVDSERIGDYNYSQNIVNKMLELAKRLRDAEAGLLGGSPVTTWAEMNLSGTEEVE
jgi:hypothetical protein